MAWLSGIAGKAEALLSQIDQATAQSLGEVGISPKKPPPSDFQSPPEKELGYPYEPVAQPQTASSSFDRQPKVSPPRNVSSAQPSEKKRTDPPFSTWGSSQSWLPTSTTSSPSSRGVRKNKSELDEEGLLEFLNSPSLESGRARTSRSAHTTQPVVQKEPGRSARPANSRKPQNSVSDTNSQSSLSKKGKKLATVDSSDETDRGDDSPSAEHVLTSEGHHSSQTMTSLVSDSSSSLSAQTQPNKVEVSAMQGMETDIHQSSSDSGHELLILTGKLSSLELENSLLKQEARSLTDELGSVMKRMREMSEGEKQLRGEVTTLRQQLAQFEQLVRKMRSQEEDLTAMLEAKDAQAEVLRSQLAMADEKVKQLRQEAQDFSREREKLIQDIGLSSSVQNQALDTVKAQLNSAQMKLAAEKETTTAMKHEFEERENGWDHERKQLLVSLETQRKSIQEQQVKLAECHASLQRAHDEMGQLRQDHSDYRQRATSILQAKDKLISTLQSGEGVGSASHDAALEEARAEKFHLLSQLQSSQQQLESLRMELQDMEDHHSTEMNQLRLKLIEAGENCSQEKIAHAVTQEDLVKIQQEMDELKNEFVREKAVLSSQLRDRQEEIQELRARRETKQGDAGAAAQREMEGRLQELTESLIQKQTVLEAISSDRNSLSLQLEKTKEELREAQRLQTSRTTHTAIDLGPDTGTEGSRIRPMASILPSSINPTPSQPRKSLQKVKTALDHMDRFSLWFGVTLRRYPQLRLVVFAYVVLLHVWVTLVLLTYKPELHEDTPGNLPHD